MMDYCIILYRVFDVEIFSFKWRNFSKFLNQEGHIKFSNEISNVRITPEKSTEVMI